MFAKNKFTEIKKIMIDARVNKDTDTLVESIKQLDLNIKDGSNFYYLEAGDEEEDGSSIYFLYRSYDPSGPFQNLPDVNKITLILSKDGKEVDKYNENFEG